MTGRRKGARSRPTRRSLVRAGAAAIAAVATAGAQPARVQTQRSPSERGETGSGEPFWGQHQGGIATAPLQRHTYVAAFDVVTTDRGALANLLCLWTAAAAAMASGQPLDPMAAQDPAQPPLDSGDVLGLPAARLTLTFGFGAGLFVKAGSDRFGLAAKRPPALVDMPIFNGDELDETRSGGDLSVQACADDSQVAFHAVRQLSRIGRREVNLRWAEAGFLPTPAEPGHKPRNLMGFHDGTNNLSVADRQAMDQFVWVGDEGPDWLRGGSYVVLRRIRIALEHWDRMPLVFQEQTFGRRKSTGAPLSSSSADDPADLGATDANGEPIIPESAHIRLASAAANDGARILRRSYSYNAGISFVTDRWPPWRQGRVYDAGLLFVCYQRDPRTGFIKIFDGLSKFDMLNQFVTHTGGGLFACPGGVAKGEFIGERLFR